MKTRLISITIIAILLISSTLIIQYLINESSNDSISIDISWDNNNKYINLNEVDIQNTWINITNNGDQNITIPTSGSGHFLNIQLTVISPTGMKDSHNYSELSGISYGNVTLEPNDTILFKQYELIYFKNNYPDVFKEEGKYKLYYSFSNIKSNVISFYYRGDDTTVWNGSFNNDYAYVGFIGGLVSHQTLFVIFDTGDYYYLEFGGFSGLSKIFNETYVNCSKQEAIALWDYLDYSVNEITSFSYVEKGNLANTSDIFTNQSQIDYFMTLEGFIGVDTTPYDGANIKIGIQDNMIHHSIVYGGYSDIGDLAKKLLELKSIAHPS